MFHSLSPEQKVAVDAMLGQSSTDIKYFDLNTVFRSIYQVILESITEHKTVLLHLPDDNVLCENIINLLHQYDLDSFAINLDKNVAIPESDIITLRSVVKKDVDTKPIIENIVAQNKLDSTLAKTEIYYNALDTKLLTNSSFRHFAASTILNGNQQQSSISINHLTTNLRLDLSEQEFHNVRRQINQAAKVYQREFDLFDRLDILNSEVWSYNIEKFDALRVSLNSLRKEGKELVKSYNETYLTLEESASKNIHQNISELLSVIKNHQQDCTAHHINETYKNPIKNKKFSFFGKKEDTMSNAVYVSAFDTVSKMIGDISSDWFDSIPAPHTDDITFEFINTFLNDCIENAPQYVQKIKTTLAHSIHRINRINTDSEEVLSLDARLAQLITKIEELNIIQHEFNGNTISFTKQMQMSKKISEVLDQCCNLIGQDTPYTLWKTQEKSNSNLSNLLIQELKSIPQDQWNTQLNLWYNEQIKSSIISDLTTNQYIIENLRSTNSTFLKSEVPAAINKLQLNRIAAANDLKSTSKELHNTLFKKKSLNANSWNDIALMARPFLQSFFPIHTNSNLNAASEYDLIISFVPRPADAPELNTVHYVSPITPFDIEDMGESKTTFLYLNDYNYSNTLAELPNSEKLKASKKLAKFILSLNQQVKIYQLKTGNIISLLPSSDDTEFENRMDKYGIKSIDTAGALYDKLTESILFTNRQPYLLIKDELINPELHQHLLWQADILHIFKTAGYKILSLNTDKQLVDNNLAFDNLLSPFIEVVNKDQIEKTTQTSPSHSIQLEVQPKS